MTRGFPNFFVMSIAQAGAAVNYVHTADEQTRTIVHVITQCMRRHVDTIQPTRQAESAWVEVIVSGAKGRRAFLEACTPGYYNYEGKRERYADLNDFYAAGPMAYIKLLEDWREKPDLPGLELTPEPR
jgi:cyclohexanone monooxygenase